MKFVTLLSRAHNLRFQFNSSTSELARLGRIGFEGDLLKALRRQQGNSLYITNS